MALSRRDKQKIADLRKRQRSSLVFSGGKKLSESEMTQRRAGIERDIRGIESQAGVAPRPSPRRSSVSSVSDTNINDLIVSNLGQQSGLPTRRVTGYEPRLSQSRNAQPGMSFSDVRTPERDMSSIPSIFSQYVPGSDVIYKQGFAQRSNELSPSLMDTLRANTGAFNDNIRLPGGLEIRRNAPRYNAPSVTPNPYVSGQQTFTPPDTKFGFDFSLPTATETPMTTDGRSFARPYSTQRGINLGTVGGFGRGLFDELASSGAGYFPQPQPDVQLTIGGFPNGLSNFGRRTFLNSAISNYMSRPFVGERGETRLPNVNVTSSPYMTPSTSLKDISVRPRGVGTDIYGNPRTYTGQELEPMYRTTIRGLLKDGKYTLY
jgi:hypothetical protein